MQHKMSSGMYITYVVRAYARTSIYIRRGLQCCCLELKAIPEPELAEQQDCSPAFLMYMRANEYKNRKILKSRNNIRSIL